MNLKANRLTLEKLGYSIVPNLYTDSEIEQIVDCINSNEGKGVSFSKTKDLFAIRQLLHEIPELKGLLFNVKLTGLLSQLFDADYFLTKAIYFDKPNTSNWFVAYHQDLSISVDKKVLTNGYSNWTFKKGQHGVIPPIDILDNTVTVRVHLDDTDKQNGALKVIPASHLNGIIRVDSDEWKKEKEDICEVERGGVMLMKPLTFHASNRTTNGKRRRVIHLEFNHQQLADPLNWLEKIPIKTT